MQKTFELRIKSTDHRLADQAVSLLVGVARAQNIKMRGPVPLPVTKGKLEKDDSKLVQLPDSERTGWLFKRRMELVDPSQEAMEALQAIHLPAAVQLRIRML